MQFEMNVGTDYSTVKFIGNYLSIDYKVRDKFIRYFQRIGGQLTEGGNWKFPLCITSEVLQEIIHNTCFVCGGLMRDDEHPYSFEKLRKCTSCGHSHT